MRYLNLFQIALQVPFFTVVACSNIHGVSTESDASDGTRIVDDSENDLDDDKNDDTKNDDVSQWESDTDNDDENEDDSESDSVSLVESDIEVESAKDSPADNENSSDRNTGSFQDMDSDDDDEDSSEREAESEIETETETETGGDSDTDSDTDSDLDSDSVSLWESDTNDDTPLDTLSDSDTESNSNTDTAASTDTFLDSGFNTDADCVIPDPGTTPIGYGAATTGGGNATPVVVRSFAEAEAALSAYRDAYKEGTQNTLVIRYTGTFDYTAITDVCVQHTLDEQILYIKEMENVTFEGAPGSSGNFGIKINRAKNVIVRNMTLGLLPGGGPLMRSP